MKAVTAGLTAVPVLLAGCASIVKGGSQDLVINSPQGTAQFELRDRKGQLSTISGTTPATVTLRRGTGYFSGAEYEIEISRPGYETSTMQIDSRVSWWYLGGNLVLGGLIGYLIVDPVTGAMWRLEPENLNVDLVPLAGMAETGPELEQWAEIAATAEPPLALPAAPKIAPAPAPVTVADAAPAVPAPALPAATPPVTLEAPAPARIGTPVAAASVAPGVTMAMPRQTAIYPQPRVANAQIRILPSGHELTLESTLSNGDGRWWFVRGAGVAGWILDAALTP